MFGLDGKKAIYVRLAIYVPLILYFGYGALRAYWARQEAAQPVQTAPKETPELQGERKEMTLPDGRTIEYVEISEEQARELGLSGDASAEAPSKAGDASNAADQAPDQAPGQAPDKTQPADEAEAKPATAADEGEAGPSPDNAGPAPTP